MKTGVNTRTSQCGAVLVVSLLMLVVITLLAVSSINLSTVNLRIVDNMRTQQEAESAAQQAIERVLGNVANFETPTAYNDLTINGIAVDTTAPVCLQAMPADGNSAVWPLAPEDTAWMLAADVTNATTGADVDIHQGVTIRLVAGSCP